MQHLKRQLTAISEVMTSVRGCDRCAVDTVLIPPNHIRIQELESPCYMEIRQAQKYVCGDAPVRQTQAAVQ